MKRSAFIAVLVAPFSLLARSFSPKGPYFVNYKTKEFVWPKGIPTKCCVDGKEIHGVWYVNTLTNTVRSYDIHQNGGKPIATESGWLGAFNIYHAPERGSVIHGALVEDADGVLSITLHGRIELFSADGGRLY